jgi:hypothetical protein
MIVTCSRCAVRAGVFYALIVNSVHFINHTAGRRIAGGCVQGFGGFRMKVSKHYLLLIACLVWGAAGFNILRIGLSVYPAHFSLRSLLLTTAVFVVFQQFVFGRLVRRHTARITAYESAQYFWKFFDRKSFAIMAFMMAGGIALRAFRLVPESFIAVFYSGLGASLLLAGLLFGRNFLRARRAA